MPTIFHQDERFYAMGEGPFLKRAVYAASRILITPNYSGNNSFNASEIFGRAVAQGISASYYPAGDRTLGDLATKYGWALGRDALTMQISHRWREFLACQGGALEGRRLDLTGQLSLAPSRFHS